MKKLLIPLILLLSFATVVAQTNIVKNGDFETGDLSNWNYNGNVFVNYQDSYVANLWDMGNGTSLYQNVASNPPVKSLTFKALPSTLGEFTIKIYCSGYLCWQNTITQSSEYWMQYSYGLFLKKVSKIEFDLNYGTLSIDDIYLGR